MIVLLSLYSIVFTVFFFKGTSALSAYKLRDDLPNLSQSEISKRVVRLHILANSDLKEDQDVKYEIKELVGTKYAYVFSQANSIDESVANTAEKLYEISSFVDDELKTKGLSYTSSASICKSSFPDKYYGDMFFPEGDYTALKITLGNGQGHNWWCVLYPPLCFIDMHEDAQAENHDTISVKWKFTQLWEKYIKTK